MREQVQSQVGVVGVGGLALQGPDRREDRHRLDVAIVVAPGQLRQFGGNFGYRQALGAGWTVSAELGLWEPRVEYGSVGGDGRQADARSRCPVAKRYSTSLKPCGPGLAWRSRRADRGAGGHPQRVAA